MALPCPGTEWNVRDICPESPSQPSRLTPDWTPSVREESPSREVTCLSHEDDSLRNFKQMPPPKRARSPDTLGVREESPSNRCILENPSFPSSMASRMRARSPETQATPNFRMPYGMDSSPPPHGRRGGETSGRGRGRDHGSHSSSRSRKPGLRGGKCDSTDDLVLTFRELAMRLVYEFSNQTAASLWTQVGESLVQLHQNMVQLAVSEKEKVRHHAPSGHSSAVCDDDHYGLADDDNDDNEIHELAPETVHDAGDNESDRRGSNSSEHFVRFAPCSSVHSMALDDLTNTEENQDAPRNAADPPVEPQSPQEVRPPHGEPVELSVLPRAESLDRSELQPFVVKTESFKKANVDFKVVDTEQTDEETARIRALEKQRSKVRSRTMPFLDTQPRDRSSPRSSCLKGESRDTSSPRSSCLKGPSVVGVGDGITSLPGFITGPQSGDVSRGTDPNKAMKNTIKAVMAMNKLSLPGHPEEMGGLFSSPSSRVGSRIGTIEWDDEIEGLESNWQPKSRSNPASRRQSVMSTARPTESRRSSVRPGLRQSHTMDVNAYKAAQFTVRDVWAAKDDELLTQKCFFDLQDENSKPTLNKTKLRKKLSSNSLGSTMKTFRFRGDTVPLHPDANIRVAWELLTLVLIGYDIIVIPLHFIGPITGMFGLFMTWLARIVWTMDIFMSFLTGVYVNGALDMRPWVVARKYVLTWLIFDICLVAQEWLSITTDETDSGSSGMSFKLDNFSAVRTLRLLRFLRLLRLLKAGFMISDIIERFNSTSFVLFCDIVKSIFGLIIINHIVACLWYGIGDTDGGWVHLDLNEMKGTSFVYRYITSLHWSLTNFSGSSEIFPRLASERFYATFIVLLALILFSSFLGNLTNTMMELQELQHERYQQQRILRRFLRENNISSMLSVRVKKYLLGIAVEDQRHGQLEKALATLPEQLIMDIHDESRGPLIAAHQFFCDLRQAHPRLLRQICHCALTDTNACMGEAIFEVGDACARMFFLMDGTLQYELKRTAQSPAGMKRKQTTDLSFLKSLSRGNSSLGLDGPLVQKEMSELSRRSDDDCVGVTTQHSLLATHSLLTRGQWISEAGIWTKWEHCGNLTTVGMGSRFFEMNADKFSGQVKNFENAYLSTKRYAMMFVNYMNSDVQCTDLLELDMTLYEMRETRNSHGSLTSSSASMTSSYYSNRSSGRGMKSFLHQVLPERSFRLFS